MLGCDYTDSIKGVGPKRAIDLINTHRNLDTILKKIDSDKFPVPENWNYKQARELFQKPEVKDPEEIDVITIFQLGCTSFHNTKNYFQLKWTDPDEDGLVKFLCGDKQFAEDRIRNGAKKLMKARGTSTQGRLDSFFTVISKTPAKRKVRLLDWLRRNLITIKS